MAFPVSYQRRGLSCDMTRLGSAGALPPTGDNAESLPSRDGSRAEDPLAAFRLGILTLEQPTFYGPSGFISTASGTRVSRKTLLFGSQNITIAGASVLNDGVVLRGDLASLRLGRFVWVGRNTLLQPCSCRSKGQVQHVPMTVGDCCIIGDDSVVQAASVGACVEIGPRCVIGNRCLLKDFSLVLPDSVLPPDTIVPSFCIFGGTPARMLGQLPEAWGTKHRLRAKNKYRLFALDAATDNAGASVTAAAGMQTQG
ncbi:dynactin [Cyclospora cayetanensis]|uniref:Dynactin subunit 5 n=1 Tax=Cyclospora cayetanensis TaxID=88456 RepID=A0A1D3D635_9EIME|nr:dynactin [Cyclospora cayetanensis]